METLQPGYTVLWGPLATVAIRENQTRQTSLFKMHSKLIMHNSEPPLVLQQKVVMPVNTHIPGPSQTLRGGVQLQPAASPSVEILYKLVHGRAYSVGVFYML